MRRPLQALAAVYALALGGALGPAVGPAVEGWVAPIFVRGDVPAGSVVRADGYLCWTWVTDKLRASAAEDIDAVLVRPAIGDISWPEVIDAHTRHAWHRLGSPHRGGSQQQARRRADSPAHHPAARRPMFAANHS